MVNTATCAITKEDMLKVIELSQHEPKIMDFAALAPAAPAGAAKPAGGKQGKGKGGGAAAAGEENKQQK